MKKLSLSFLAVLLSCSAWAYDALIDGIYYNFNTDVKTAEVTHNEETNKSYSGDIIIPSSVTYSNVTYSITGIGEMAFLNCPDLTSIVIPGSVTSIGMGAFAYCKGLASIEIGKSVTSFGDYAFLECPGLTSITVAEGNPVYDSRNNCNAVIETATDTLKLGCVNTVIPYGIKHIGNCAFYGCVELVKVNLPDTLETIGNRAFKSCPCIGEITIPENVTRVGNEAFNRCMSLKKIAFKDITKIKTFFRSNFYTVPALTTIICGNDVPKNVAKVIITLGIDQNNDTFLDDKYLTKLTKKELEEMKELYIKNENASVVQKIVEIYNNKYGKDEGPNLKI